MRSWPAWTHRGGGLSSEEAARRRARHGPNRLREEPPVPAWRILLEEFRSPLVLVLIGAAVVLFLVANLGGRPEETVDAALIVAIVVLNAALGFVQNYRAQRGIEALKRLSAPSATYLRDGAQVTGPAEELVPGDVFLLEEGDRVPADGRLLEAHDLSVDESALTGESLTVVSSGQRPLALAVATAMGYAVGLAVGRLARRWLGAM